MDVELMSLNLEVKYLIRFIEDLTLLFLDDLISKKGVKSYEGYSPCIRKTSPLISNLFLLHIFQYENRCIRRMNLHFSHLNKCILASDISNINQTDRKPTKSILTEILQQITLVLEM